MNPKEILVLGSCAYAALPGKRDLVDIRQVENHVLGYVGGPGDDGSRDGSDVGLAVSHAVLAASGGWEGQGMGDFLEFPRRT